MLKSVVRIRPKPTTNPAPTATAAPRGTLPKPTPHAAFSHIRGTGPPAPDQPGARSRPQPRGAGQGFRTGGADCDHVCQHANFGGLGLHNTAPMPPDRQPPPPSPAAADESDLTARLAAYIRATRNALSHNTERAFRGDLSVFRNWCAARGATAIPASPDTISSFIDAIAAVRAPATVRRYVASIAVAHRSIGSDARLRSPIVKLALQRMHRRRGRRQKQVLGLTWPLRQRLIDAPGERLIDARNRALLAVAYDAMLRRSELSAARVADLALDIHGGATLLVRRGKTDAEGRSATLYLARDTATLLTDWLRRSGVTDGQMFRSLNKGGAVGNRLDPSQIPRIYKAMARVAGLPSEVVDGLSGHSARVGAAQDMIASGIELPAILQAGRWKTTTMVSRYGERLLPRRSGAAQLARLQGRG